MMVALKEKEGVLSFSPLLSSVCHQDVWNTQRGKIKVTAGFPTLTFPPRKFGYITSAWLQVLCG